VRLSHADGLKTTPISLGNASLMLAVFLYRRTAFMMLETAFEECIVNACYIYCCDGDLIGVADCEAGQNRVYFTASRKRKKSLIPNPKKPTDCNHRA
jgi:hypothetical protein